MRDFIKRHSTIIVLATILLLSSVSLWLSGKTVIPSPRDIGMAVTTFFQGISASIGDFIGKTVNSVQQLADLQTQYNVLAERLQEYEKRQSDIESLRSENDRLRMALGFAAGIPYRNLPAQIIGKDPGILFTTITVNKGFNDGIRKGMPVIAIQGGGQGLVGRIQEVSPWSSHIIPIFDLQSFVAGRVEKNRFEGLIQGSGSSIQDLQMVYVAEDAKHSTAVGDMVVTSGLKSVFPPNIIVGTISSISSKPYESSLELTVRPFIEFSQLEYVYILIPDEGGIQ